MYDLPVEYDALSGKQRSEVRGQYFNQQLGKCCYCEFSLTEDVAYRFVKFPLNMELFPPDFLNYPIHLQHDRKTGLTQGVVHNYCNGILWQYYGL